MTALVLSATQNIALFLPRAETRAGWRRALALMGPGWLVAVGYVDPGNWATDIGGGAQFGFALLSVVLLASLVAMAVQALAARIAVVTGKDLATLAAERLPRPAATVLWIVGEIGIVATDLAELLGSAVALKLLFGLTLTAGLIVAALATLALLALPDPTGRLRQWLIGLLLAVVAGCYAVELFIARPDPVAMLAGFTPPLDLLSRPEMLMLALGIVGATIMPHNIFLHSGLVAERMAQTPPRHGLRDRLRAVTLDSTLALSLAFLVNAAILVVSATAFHAGNPSVAGIEEAHALLNGLLDARYASVLFAIALLAAGQSSTITGTMAGEMIMRSLIGRRIPTWARGLITRALSLGAALAFFGAQDGEAVDGLLVASQVTLSLVLPFVLLPLIAFAASRRLLGDWAIGRTAAGAMWAIAGLLTGLNGFLIAAAS